MKRLLPLLLVVAVGCGSTPLRKAFNVEAAATAAYKAAAPMRAELCRPPSTVPQNLCDQSLKVLKADYVAIQQYGSLLSAYISNKDKALERQLAAMGPQIEAATREILQLIAELKR